MDEVLVGLEALAPIKALRFSRWAYAGVNTLHVFAIALLVGGAVPLALRLLGLWSTAPRAAIVRILSTTAATGLALALASGGLLFATRAPEYAANPAFLAKIVLVTVGTVSAIVAHMRHGGLLEGAGGGTCRRLGLLSIVCWTGALICGRLIAFVQG